MHMFPRDLPQVRRQSLHRPLAHAGLGLLALLLAGCGGSGSGDSPESEALQISVVSSRADMVTGTDAVVQVTGPGVGSSGNISIALNGADVTSSLRYDSAGNRLVGRISGLRQGDNDLVAQAKSGGTKQELAMTSYPSYGPIFAGPHESPYACETSASGLGAPQDSYCTVPRKYDWFYRSTTDNTFKPLASLAKPYPADLASATTIDGKTVDFIIRVESGVFDRAIYRIALLADPLTPSFDPWSASGPTRSGEGWNGRLDLVYGGSWSTGYRSGSNTMPANLEALPLSYDTAVDPLRMGFAVAFTTRMSLGMGGNSIRSAENTMMLKEHFIKEYGAPKYTIGSGPSGGSMQLHVISGAYPGLFDALSVGVSFPDTQSITQDILDCVLIQRYTQASAGAVTSAIKSKITGYGQDTCTSYGNGFGLILAQPTLGLPASVPASARYNPVANPTGIRGNIMDTLVNYLGIDPATGDESTGYARSTYDNVGVQYGLAALNDGSIDFARFLDLNANIGGISPATGLAVATRTAGNVDGISRAFSSGLVFSGKGVTLPIVDSRAYSDNTSDIHTRERTFETIERLKAANGTAANQVNWLAGGVFNVTGAAFTPDALVLLDKWLAAIATDTSGDSYAQKVIKNKPAAAVDGCRDASGNFIAEPFSQVATSQCNTLYPIYGNPRLAAGAPMSGDVMKCQLKPVDPADYKVALTAAQLDQLRAVFPDGVCDWTKPSVGRVDVATWQRY